MITLYDSLLTVTDPRRDQGIRTPLAAFLEMIILAVMSGNTAIRAISRFIDRNEDYFVQRYDLKHGTPGYTNLRNFLAKLDYEELNVAVKKWCIQYLDGDDWIGIDGKAIRSTVTNYQNTGQNFLSMVSMFCSKKGLVIDTQSLENKKMNEGLTAREMISQCELKGLTFTMDALHCQKKQPKLSWSQEMTTYFK